MKLHVGKLPEAPDFNPEQEGYKPIREVGPIVVSIVGGLVGVALSFIVVVLAWPVIPPAETWLPDEISSEDLTVFMFKVLIGLVFASVVLTALHEIVHYVLFPRGSQRFIGFWPSRLLFYAHTHGALSRERFLLVFAAPFVTLSLLPIPILWVAGVQSGTVVAMIAFHALLCGGDLIGFTSVALQVPRGATVRNKGWNTYWKTTIGSGGRAR